MVAQYPTFKSCPSTEIPQGIAEQDNAAWYHWIMYSWVRPLLDRGLTRLKDGQMMQDSDLLNLPTYEDPSHNTKILQEFWNDEVESFKERIRAYEAIHGPINSKKKIAELIIPSSHAPDDAADTAGGGDGSQEMTAADRRDGDKKPYSPVATGAPPAPEEADEEEWPVETPSLARALRRAFWKRIALGGVFRLVADGSSFAFPFLLREFIKWMREPDGEIYVGFMWVIGIVGSNVMMSTCLNAATHHTTTGFTRMTTALPILIYDKVLTLAPDHGMTGHLTTLHASDSQRFAMGSQLFHGCWVSPLLLIGAAIALYIFVGVAGIVAVFVLLLTSPIQAILTAKLMRFRQDMVRVQDRRLAAINEALQGIRIAKFMCWETRFEERIREIREEEVAVMRTSQIYKTIVWFIAGLIPALTMIGVFILFYYLEGDVSTERVLPAMSMLNVIRIPVLLIPMSFASLIDVSIAMRRIQKFLMRPDIAEYVQTDGEPGTVSVENVSIMPPLSCGDTDVPILENIRCSVEKGSFTIIHGPTGCGKSTLVKCLIGESRLSADSGAVRVSGSVAYISQEAWIMNATVRGNILMGLPFDEDLYDRVVDACQLRDDYKQFPHGDQTEIGERGVNLSGGQKQRIAFARAAYSNRDIIIMDDPLSAFDAHVSRALVEKCILALMAGKTRILVTHQIQYLHHCQHVIEMGARCITFAGEPPAELVQAAKEASAKAIEEEESKRQESLELRDTDASAETPPSNDDNDPIGPDDVLVQVAGGVVDDQNLKTPKKNKALMSKEDIVVGGVSWEVYSWYTTLGTFKWAALTLLFGIIWRTSSVFGDLWLSWWSGKVKIFGRSYSETEYMACFSVCVGAGVFLNALWQLFLAFFVVEVSKNSHHSMISRVLRAPTSFFDTTPMGRILNRFSKDMDNMDTVISESLRQMLSMCLILVGTVAVVIYTSPFILVVVPFLILMLRSVYNKYVTTVRNLKQLEATSRSPMMAVLNETLGGLSTIRAYGMSAHFRTTHIVRAQAAAVPPYCSRCCQRWLSFHTESIGNLALFVVVYMGALIIIIGDGGLGITVPVISLAITYVTATTNAITFLTRTAAEFEASMSSTERVREYSLEIPVERDVTYRKIGDTTSDTTNPEAPPSSWPQSGAIVMKDVMLRYRPELELVLKGVNFTIPGGSKVGIVGRTGSGKSTIILSLFRMIELDGGSISIDGLDVANVSLYDLRSSITIIPQEPVLFTGTLRSNVDPFDDQEDSIIWSVLEKCRMKARVEEAGGLDSPVEERGSNFSVGQRQLLCLARAMLKRCKILLLDEATASVDFEVDALIQETIRTEFKECTVITIAHRLETIIDADKVIVMSNGCVDEIGSPHTLLNGGRRTCDSDILSGTLSGMVRALGDVKCKALKIRAMESYYSLRSGDDSPDTLTLASDYEWIENSNVRTQDAV